MLGKELYNKKREKQQAVLQLQVLDKIYVAGDEFATFENLLKKIKELNEKINND